MSGDWELSAPVHVEVVQKSTSTASRDQVCQITRVWLMSLQALTPGATLSGDQLDTALALHAESVTICDADYDSDVRVDSVQLRIHVCRLLSGTETDELTDAGGEDVPVAEVWPLPSSDLHGMWESLVFDEPLKRDVLRFMEVALEFGEAGVDPHLVSCNRVVLLHGPPGTGKTSLCRALAHKLSVRLGDRFPRARLLEINAHGLFSRWFSESGKLVARLFERVREVATDPRLLVIVLVDEVESLAAARRAAAAGLEPSDALRAVNALLTQLDRLRRLPNCLVLTTTNVAGAVDCAFADRADLRRHVPPPGPTAAYRVLRSCLEELMLCGLVAPREPLFAERVVAASGGAGAAEPSARLRDLATAAARAQLSGRALRRLPMLAAALYMHSPPASLSAWLMALGAALTRHTEDTKHFVAAAARDLKNVPDDSPTPNVLDCNDLDG